MAVLEVYVRRSGWGGVPEAVLYAAFAEPPCNAVPHRRLAACPVQAQERVCRRAGAVMARRFFYCCSRPSLIVRLPALFLSHAADCAASLAAYIPRVGAACACALRTPQICAVRRARSAQSGGRHVEAGRQMQFEVRDDLGGKWVGGGARPTLVRAGGRLERGAVWQSLVYTSALGHPLTTVGPRGSHARLAGGAHGCNTGIACNRGLGDAHSSLTPPRLGCRPCRTSSGRGREGGRA